jgi:hypothetical protein
VAKLEISRGFMEKEARSVKITWRVFTKTDIRRIAKVLNEAFQNAKKNKHHSSIAFRLYCQGGISYESDSINILDDGGPLDIKRTQTIQITFYDYETERNIDFSIREGNYYGGELSVRGTDKNWVQGNFTTLQEIIDSIKPQENVILKYKNIVFHIIAFGTGSLFYLLLNFLIFQHIPIPNRTIEISSEFLKSVFLFLKANLWILYLILVFLLWFEGVVTFAYPLHKWLLELWPEIEFDFGPDHLNKNKIRRQRIWIVASLVIIPIAVNIFTNFLVFK